MDRNSPYRKVMSCLRNSAYSRVWNNRSQNGSRRKYSYTAEVLNPIHNTKAVQYMANTVLTPYLRLVFMARLPPVLQ